MTHSIHRMLALVLLALVCACGSGDEAWTRGPGNSGSPAGSSRPSGKGVCALLMQGEVDELFGTSVGAGVEESLSDGSQICSWPAGEDPSLLLQIGAAAPDILAAVDLGEGYRVAEVPGMSGPAAVVTEADGSDQAVTILGMNVGEKSIIVSPVGLGLQEGSPRFERLKELLGVVAQRM